MAVFVSQCRTVVNRFDLLSVKRHHREHLSGRIVSLSFEPGVPVASKHHIEDDLRPKFHRCHELIRAVMQQLPKFGFPGQVSVSAVIAVNEDRHGGHRFSQKRRACHHGGNLQGRFFRSLPFPRHQLQHRFRSLHTFTVFERVPDRRKK